MDVVLRTSLEELKKFQKGEPFIAAADKAGVGAEVIHTILVDLRDYEIEKAHGKPVGYVEVKRKTMGYVFRKGPDGLPMRINL